MAYDGKILAKARERLEEIRSSNEAEHARREAEIYNLIPEIQSIDFQLRGHMAELASLAFSRCPDVREKIAELRDRNLSMQMRRAELLKAHGFPIDYLDEIISCGICRDTGLNGMRICSCLKTLYNAELTKELSTLLRRGDECFENFDLSLYPEEYSEQYDCVPRVYMKKVFERCRKFADSFPDTGENLLMSGDPGLGKTYLSACIARAVSEKGYSVCYDNVGNAFDAFERQKFSRDQAEQENAAAKVRQMLNCDLMILDDLGTEFVTPATTSALYTLINTRSVDGKHTVINTTFTHEELEKKYTSSICSRLEGDFLTLYFAGSDIRKLLKKQ